LAREKVARHSTSVDLARRQPCRRVGIPAQLAGVEANALGGFSNETVWPG
jgi:hypothetical protein